MEPSETLPSAVQLNPAPPIRTIAIRGLALAATAFLTLTALGLISLSIFDSTFQNRVYPGVSIADLDLSGLTSAEAARQLIGGFDYPQTGRISFLYGGRTWAATPEELGLSIDYLTSINNAYAVGRSPDSILNLSAIYTSRFLGASVSPVLQYDVGKTLAYLQAIAAEIEQPVLEARLELSGAEVHAYSGQTGRFVDMATMLSLVAVPIGHLTDGEIPLVVREETPQVMDASQQAELARTLLSQDFSVSIAEPVSGDSGPWVLQPAVLAEMLAFRRVFDGDSPRYAIVLDENKLASFLRPLTGMLYLRAENARFTFDDASGQLALYQAAKRGRALNVDQSVAAIQAAIGQGLHQASLSFEYVDPDVRNDSTAAGLGITGLLPKGEQWTSFRSSPDGRINNIIIASEKFNGVLIAPGETLSMADHLGTVSLDTGYSEGLIIMGNRTIKGTGGGVCQVSTTLFRAAFMTGFPIAERHAHAYRVGYYEVLDGPTPLGAGFDATVFVPEVDFKFLNDSSYWILMETEVDRTTSRLIWRFYSTPDGRSVTYTSTGIINQTNPPDPKWYASTDVAPGKWKQIDYAVKGADVNIHRTVTRNGQLIISDYFNTHYIPWPAQCLYHPSSPVPDGTSCPPS